MRRGRKLMNLSTQNNLAFVLNLRH